MTDIFIVALAALVLLCVSIAQAYRAVPVYELKRRARHGDKSAKLLYNVAAYGFSAQLLLWLIATLAGAGFFELIAKNSPVWIALTGCVALLWLGFIWIPRSSLNFISKSLAQVLSKPICFILLYLDKPVKFVKLHLLTKSRVPHTGLYENSDLVNLLKRQQQQTDNRIEQTELEMLKAVLVFNREKIMDIMIPRRKLVAINVKDTLGPILLDEIHKSEQVYFPVYENKQTNVVGFLDVSNLEQPKDKITAERLMSKTLYYVHEEDYANTVLRAIVKTHQHMFVVVNNEGEYTGLITSKIVLSKLLGNKVADEFDQYEDKELVAKHLTSLENLEPEETKDSTEVLE